MRHTGALKTETSSDPLKPCMKLALLSDIHANRQALQACLLHAHAQGVDRHAFLGDLVGYGADPIAVLDQVMALAEQGAIVIQGNHDLLAVQPAPTVNNMGESTAAWTHQQLKDDHLDFLAHLPLTAQLDHLLLVHASAHQPERWPYVDNARAAQACLQAAMALNGRQVAHVLVGHVHQQTLYYKGSGAGLMPFQPSAGVPVPIPASRSCVATVGSVGQPRDGDTRAMYAVYDTSAQRLVFHRVAYDHAQAAAAIRSAGLPDFFAQRLETGR